jgi:superfamily II DNA/RNA helicase/very-short-patch-repair endonuclease
MNPIRIAESLREEYLQLLRTEFRPRQEHLREAFESEITREGFLTREPFVSLAQPFKIAPPLTDLHTETFERFLPITQTPFAHQAEACQRILAGEPAIVCTGTGSGKTEAFQIPIVDHCLRNRTTSPALKAIFIYPMNALATDQRNRIRDRLAGSGITYGRYTGETQLWGDRPQDLPEEERCLRSEFCAAPPDLLLTNYSMLEYMLLRGDGRDIFRNHRVRFIVLDEVHTYGGMLGTDVAFLLRRLTSALRAAWPEGPAPLFIGTSATLQSGEEGVDPDEEVAHFFTQLTGQDTAASAVIREQTERPTPPASLRLGTPPVLTDEDLEAFVPPEDTSWEDPAVLGLARKLLGGSATATLAECWEATLLPHLLMEWLDHPLPLDGIVAKLAAREERLGVAQEDLARELQAALLLGPCLPPAHPLCLRPRVHRFLRGLARFWRCTNPDCGKLLDTAQDACDECGAKSLPLALCRTCGWDFLVGSSVAGKGDSLLGTPLKPWQHKSTSHTVYLYDAPPARLQVEPEDDPQAGDDEEELDEPVDEAAEEEIEDAPVAAEPEAYLCTGCLALVDKPVEDACACGEEAPLRPVRVHRGRATRCPICSSRYGSHDVLTPVSLGNSSALTHVSRILLRHLPADKRKLLIFCDSRQDAAHQARFMAGVEGHLRLRRAIYRALRDAEEGHDLEWIVDEVYEHYLEQGFVPRTRSRDAQKRGKEKIWGGLLSELIIASAARHSILRLGLVGLGYAGLADDLEREDLEQICDQHELPTALVQYAIPPLLDFIRSKMAVDHEAFTQPFQKQDRLAQALGIVPGRGVGRPRGFRMPGFPKLRGDAYDLLPTWNSKGNHAGLQSLWLGLLAEKATPESLTAVLEWLVAREYLVWSQVGDSKSNADGLQVALEAIELQPARTHTQCGICGRRAVNGVVGAPCVRRDCAGTMDSWEGPLADGNLDAKLIDAEYLPPLMPAEHSAAVPDTERQEVERKFMADPPELNVLACTPTLELGVNIGDLEAVAMRNVPPSPANYAQRTGRMGRSSRMGVAAGFARETPHDGYFFDHPEEVITGSIPAPRFNLANMEALARHVRSMVLETAAIDFPANMVTYINEDGQLQTQEVEALRKTIGKAETAAAERALVVFGGNPAVTVEWLAATASATAEAVEKTIAERAQAIEAAATKMKEAAVKVAQRKSDETAEKGFRQLANRLRADHRHAYLPRVLAEQGVIPGYAFPGDPGSLSLAYDPGSVMTGRLQAQREFAPGQVVYARGCRWRVRGLALHRPGALGSGSEVDRFQFSECTSCGLANPAAGANACMRCGAELPEKASLAIDAGAFQAWPDEVEPETEEERLSLGYDVRVHPQRDAAGKAWRIGDWRLELRSQEAVWWINHGRLGISEKGASLEAQGFYLCETCGELLDPPKTAKPKAKADKQKDPRSRQDRHAEVCSGKPGWTALGHQGRADTLRLVTGGLEGLGSEGVAWAWSFAYAVVQGAVREFFIDEEDIEPVVLTRRGEDGETVHELLWVDTSVGGSGILQTMAERFPGVARAALRHLDGHDCPSSCYRCLRTYRNQRQHGSLQWRIVVPNLAAIGADECVSAADLAPARDEVAWAEARAEGCESPQELRLLQALRAESLPEPEKQHEVLDARGQIISRADFAYPEQHLLIYVDGLAFHSSLRQRVHDNRQSAALQAQGWRIRRFLGPEVHRRAADCAAQVRDLLSACADGSGSLPG